MTHLRASCPLQFPLFSYSLDYDRRMTYVIFKGSKTRNRNPALDQPTRIFSRKKDLNAAREIFSPPPAGACPDLQRPTSQADSRTSRLLVTTRQRPGLR